MKKIANSQSTRSQVANAVVVSSKAVGDAVEDARTKALWKEIGNSVFDFADKNENRDTEV